MNVTASALKKSTVAALCGVAALLFLCSGQYFFNNRLYLSNTDSFYYYNIAENLHQTGKLQSTVQHNAERVGTPQIGIVLVMAVLMKMGLERDGVFIAIALLYFLLYAASAWPLYRLGRSAGLSSLWGGVLVAAFLANAENLFDNMQVLNEGAFGFLALWVLFFAARILEMERDRPAAETRRVLYFLNGALLVLCSSAMVLFRVQGMLIVLSIAAAAFFLGVRKPSLRAALYAGILFCITLAMFYIVNHWYGVSRHGFFSQTSIACVIKPGRFLQKAILFGQNYLFFWAALVLLCSSLFKPDSIVRLLLATAGVSTFVFTFALDYFLITSRYLAYIWPITFIFILIEPRLRYAGCALIVLMMLQSTLACRRVHEFYCYEPLYLHLHSRNTVLPQNSVLVSYPPYDRMTRYFLRTPVWHSVDECSNALKTENQVFVAGPREYLSHQVALAKTILQSGPSENRRRIAVDTVSAGFADKEGDALLRLRLTDRTVNDSTGSD